MQQSIRNLFQGNNLKKITDVRNIALTVFLIIVFALTWSGIRAAQKNYDLQKQIAVLKQQNGLLKLGNQNTQLQNKYYETNEYLELAARRNFGLAAPGETVLLVPKNVAMSYVNQSLDKQSSQSDAQDQKSASQSKTSKNLHDWRDFLLGRKLFAD